MISYGLSSSDYPEFHQMTIVEILSSLDSISSIHDSPWGSYMISSGEGGNGSAKEGSHPDAGVSATSIFCHPLAAGLGPQAAGPERSPPQQMLGQQ